VWEWQCNSGHHIITVITAVHRAWHDAPPYLTYHVSAAPAARWRRRGCGPADRSDEPEQLVGSRSVVNASGPDAPSGAAYPEAAAGILPCRGAVRRHRPV